MNEDELTKAAYDAWCAEGRQPHAVAPNTQSGVPFCRICGRAIRWGEVRPSGSHWRHAGAYRS